MAWSLINTVSAGGETSTITTGAIDTTGADLIVVVVSYSSGQSPEINDNMGNGYYAHAVDGTAACDIYYISQPTVGAGHTFTMGFGSPFAPAITVAAYHSGNNVYVDKIAHATGLSAGSITPTADGDLIVAGLYGGTATAFSIGSSFSIAVSSPFSSGNNVAGAQAYFAQGTAGAINPTWSDTGGSSEVSSIASFKVPALKDGLIAYWECNDGSGTTLADSTGNGHTATLVSSSWVAGHVTTNAVSFDGTNAANAGATTDVANAFIDFTACCWFKPAGVVNSFERLVDKTYTTGFWLGRNGTSSNFGGGVEEGSSPYGIYTGAVTDGTWNLLVSRKKGVTHTISINGGALTTSATVTGSETNTSKVSIANDNGNQTGSGFAAYNGVIQSVGVWDRALTDAEITSLYNSGAGLAYPLTPSSPSTVVPRARNIRHR